MATSSSDRTPAPRGSAAIAATLPPVSRSRDKPAGEEQAETVLQLGEFSGVPSLSLSEARHIINAVLDGRRAAAAAAAGGGRGGGGEAHVEETETLAKTRDYLDQFARFKQKESIEAVERLLSSRGELVAFERSQLGSLVCGDGEEAMSLIPSLAGKMGKAELDDLTKEIQNLRTFLEGP